jgi:hypothetical protein
MDRRVVVGAGVPVRVELEARLLGFLLGLGADGGLVDLHGPASPAADLMHLEQLLLVAVHDGEAAAALAQGVLVRDQGEGPAAGAVVPQ